MATPVFSGLLVSHRCTHVPRVGASLESHALAHPNFRLDVTRNRNVTSDDRVWLNSFKPTRRRDRPLVIVVLEGRLQLFQTGVWLSADAGEMVVLPGHRALLSRRSGPRFLSLALEWDTGTLCGWPRGGGRIGRVSNDCSEELRHLADRVASESFESSDAAGVLARVVSVFRGARVLPSWTRDDELFAGMPPRSILLSRALDRLLSDLSQRPMLVDLERATGMCSRHIHRMVASLHARYGFDAAGWRDALNRRRLMVGSALMTAPGATVGLVASATGYGSRAALWRAFAEAKLPPPTVLANPTAVLRRGFGGGQANRVI
jgi:hypothetical protein